VFDGREIAQRVSHSRTDIEQDELSQAEKEQERDRAKRNNRGDDLVLCQHRSKATDRQIKHSEQ
jgi:hypothetical protein